MQRADCSLCLVLLWRSVELKSGASLARKCLQIAAVNVAESNLVVFTF